VFNNLYNAANEIRTLLMPFAFILCVIGIGETGWRAGSDLRAILGTSLKCIVIVTLIAGYPDIMRGGQSAFIELRNKFTSARDAKFVQLLHSTVQNQPSDSITEIGKIVPAAIGNFFQGIGRFMLLVLRFFQEFAIAGLIAVSPLLIGFLFFSYTQSVSVHFGVTSLTVLLWHVAICLVDITIQLISDVLFLPITTGGLVQTAQNMIVVLNWLHFPFIMAFAFPTVFFYLSVPFVAAALMKGLSGATASLQGGVHGSMQAAGLAIGTGLTVAGAASTFGGSAAAMNQIKLSLRAADDPRIIKEEAGVPLFASVFALRNVMKLGRDETIPLTVKASQDLARTLVTELRKGVSFIVEGQLAYFRNPETNRETYSILADQITDIVPPKSCKPIP
jgi:hypothetical protein